jgi:LmbE family N-acetylglucosaminyl deacetylase
MHPLSLDAVRPLKHLLCLGAHCDDLEIGCGGTVLALLAAKPGLAVDWVIFSSTPERAAEARRAATAILGEQAHRRVTIHDWQDSYLPRSAAEIKECLQALARDISPDLILTHHRGDAHQDHRLIGEITWQAFRNHLIWEYEIPKYDGDLGRPNLYVPLTPELVARKVAIILDSFPSQAAKAWFTADTFRALLRLRGIESGGGTGWAEAFHAPKLVLDPGAAPRSGVP